MINVFYGAATRVQPTGTPRQWRVQFEVERDGIMHTRNILFPDDIQTAITAGLLTRDEVEDAIFNLVLTAVRRRDGLD